MANKKISELSAGSTLTGDEFVEAVQSGSNVKITTQAIANLGVAGLNHWRGSWAGTTDLPDTGDNGNGTGGAPAAGDEWRLTNTLSIGGNVYSPGTLIKAAIDSPGQTLSNWMFFAMQL